MNKKLIVSVAVILIFGWILYSNYKTSSTLDTSKKSQTPTLDMSSWGTYTNEKFGFQFKYPSEYNLTYEDLTKPQEYVACGAPYSRISISTKASGSFLASIHNGKGCTGGPLSEKTSNNYITGTSVKKYIGIQSENKDYLFYSFSTKNDSFSVNVSYEYGRAEEILDAIFSTLKLIN